MLGQRPVGETLALLSGGRNDGKELGERGAEGEDPAPGIKFLAETVGDDHQQIKLAGLNDYGEYPIDLGAGLR